MWQSLTYYSMYIHTALCTWEYSQHNSSSSRYTKNVYFSSECMGDAGVVLVCVFVCPGLFCVQTAHHRAPQRLKSFDTYWESGIRYSRAFISVKVYFYLVWWKVYITELITIYLLNDDFFEQADYFHLGKSRRHI